MLGITGRSDLVRDVVDFVLERFTLLLSKISHFIAVEFFPALCLGSSQYGRLAKNVTIA